MRKTFFLFLLLYFPTIVFSQNNGENFLKKKKEKPPITLYKIISAQRDTTYLDTTLNIQKEYIMTNTITLTDPLTLQQYIVDEGATEITPPEEFAEEDASSEAAEALADAQDTEE